MVFILWYCIINDYQYKRNTYKRNKYKKNIYKRNTYKRNTYKRNKETFNNLSIESQLEIWKERLVRQEQLLKTWGNIDTLMDLPTQIKNTKNNIKFLEKEIFKNTDEYKIQQKEKERNAIINANITMNKATFNIDLLNMSYQEVINFLWEKYGKIEKNYFTSTLKSKTQIGRGNEGLFIHHIREDSMILLSNNIKKHPVIDSGILDKDQINLMYSEYQKGENLVYCNLLEHAILHIKIMEEPKPMIPQIEVGVGGLINYIIPELNDIFSGIQYKAKYKMASIAQVIKFKKEYKQFIHYCMDKFNEWGRDINTLFSSFHLNVLAGWDCNNNKKLYNEIIEEYNNQ